MLRDYQQRSKDQVYEWFEKNPVGNPCLVLPTGSGKSWLNAAIIADALQNWPQTRVLMLTHVKELIEQNADKMRLVWPNAPMGIYAAGLNRREIGEPITFASVQSVRNRAKALGHIDLVIIDECHLINNRKQGGYRKLLDELEEINPNLRVLGLTASPYRLGQGMVTDGDEPLFHDILEPVLIEELISKKYLARLVSKHTKMQLDTTGVRHRGGEFVAKDLNAAVTKDGTSESAVQEIVQRGADYRSWLIFCVSVEHAEQVRDEVRRHGISCESVTGSTPSNERRDILERFKSGDLRAVTNCEVLTTGFDHPDLDLIAMLRPTESPGLYQQIVGRGTRIKSHTDHCLILDFAGNIERHGPITNIRPPAPGGKRKGDAPVKICPDCDEIVHLSVMVCPECGYQWEKSEPSNLHLRNHDIMGEEPSEAEIGSWDWRVQKSRRTGIDMIKVRYFQGIGRIVATEYLCLLHPGTAGNKAAQKLYEILNAAGVKFDPSMRLPELAEFMRDVPPPSSIKYRKEGKFETIIERNWNGKVETD